MTIAMKMQPVDRDLVVKLTGTGPIQSAMLAAYAREQLAAALAQDEGAAGFAPTYTTFVDGVPDASEDNVKPNGTIVYEFDLVGDILAWIAQTLEESSPIGDAGDPHPGLYARSHVMFADGALADANNPPPNAQEYIFVNSQPYARKIEQGSSSQFPDGVYEVVAAMARAKFGAEAKITFNYHAINGGEIGKWAQSLSARAHASKHHRRSRVQDWLTSQPAIFVDTLK